jgi:hypothetical protein
MSAAQLMMDLAQLGIQLEARGDRLRYRPQSLVTPDLADRMKAHKGELLAILQSETNAAIIPDDATALWQAALDRLQGASTGFPADIMEALRSADARWMDEPDVDQAEESTEVIDPPNPCPECGSLELWQSPAGDWRCLRCDPPTKSRQLRELAARLRDRPADR